MFVEELPRDPESILDSLILFLNNRKTFYFYIITDICNYN